MPTISEPIAVAASGSRSRSSHGGASPILRQNRS